MPQSAHASNINFSTAFEVDKICSILSNTFTAAAYNIGGFAYQYTIPHNLTRPAFCDALFSANGTTFVPNGQNDTSFAYECYSDSSNFYLLTTANSGTIYYKLVSTWIDNFDATNPLITPVFNATLPSVNNTVNFDSRKNYQKVFKQNMVTLSNPGVGNTGTFTFNHNLGYNPNYKIFFESQAGQVWPLFGNGNSTWLYNGTQYYCTATVNSNALTIQYTPGATSASTFRLWYRVYYDS